MSETLRMLSSGIPYLARAHAETRGAHSYAYYYPSDFLYYAGIMLVLMGPLAIRIHDRAGFFQQASSGKRWRRSKPALIGVSSFPVLKRYLLSVFHSLPTTPPLATSLRPLLRCFCDGLKQGARDQVLLGVTGSGQNLHMAQCDQKLQSRRLSWRITKRWRRSFTAR